MKPVKILNINSPQNLPFTLKKHNLPLKTDKKTFIQ